MIDREIALKARELGMPPEDAFKRIRAAGWHIKKFPHNKVVAVNPYYKDFGLSIAGSWINLGFLENEFFLYIYPTVEILDVLGVTNPTEVEMKSALFEMQSTLAPRSERDLFWFKLEGHLATWVYMLNSYPLASVWWVEDSHEWFYSIPIHKKAGKEKYQIDAMACVEESLANDDSLDRG